MHVQFPWLLSLGSQQLYQAQDHPRSLLSQCPLLSPTELYSQSPQGEPSHTHGVCRLSPNPFATPPCNLAMPCSGEHLRHTATARSKYCQKDLISSAHCLQNCRIALLAQVPLKAKLSLPAGQHLSHQLLYLQQWTHYTKKKKKNCFQGQCPA